MSGVDDAIQQYQALKERLNGTLGEEEQRKAIPEAEELANNRNLSAQFRESLRFKVAELKAKWL
ncbi:hypothetical protein [Pantanalinema sp. GBBB05]|uniref:hypothetical protein n=1 Tax=Pantanalinema sp. GBBB05 TaxID=2604139 RepID=UPI001D1AB5E6|nr:hypothetical protein [Pantanalinema sp. GBBB05]